MVSADKINEMYLKASLGEISSFDFWNELGFDSEDPEIEREYLDRCLKIDPEFTGIAKKITRIYRMG
jgi:putative hydrolase of the HAD superfamily